MDLHRSLHQLPTGKQRAEQLQALPRHQRERYDLAEYFHKASVRRSLAHASLLWLRKELCQDGVLRQLEKEFGVLLEVGWDQGANVCSVLGPDATHVAKAKRKLQRLLEAVEVERARGQVHQEEEEEEEEEEGGFVDEEWVAGSARGGGSGRKKKKGSGRHKVFVDLVDPEDREQEYRDRVSRMQDEMATRPSQWTASLGREARALRERNSRKGVVVGSRFEDLMVVEEEEEEEEQDDSSPRTGERKAPRQSARPERASPRKHKGGQVQDPQGKGGSGGEKKKKKNGRGKQPAGKKAAKRGGDHHDASALLDDAPAVPQLTISFMVLLLLVGLLLLWSVLL